MNQSLSIYGYLGYFNGPNSHALTPTALSAAVVMWSGNIQSLLISFCGTDKTINLTLQNFRWAEGPG